MCIPGLDIQLSLDVWSSESLSLTTHSQVALLSLHLSLLLSIDSYYLFFLFVHFFFVSQKVGDLSCYLNGCIPGVQNSV